MRAGLLRHRVAILRQGMAIDDGLTTKPGEWIEIATRKANVKGSTGRAVSQQQGQDTEYPATFTLRSDPVTRSITDKDRIGYRGLVYHLDSALPDGTDGIVCIGVARG